MESKGEVRVLLAISLTKHQINGVNTAYMFSLSVELVQENLVHHQLVRISRTNIGCCESNCTEENVNMG